MTLDAQILKAHDHGDKSALVDLYSQAADQAADVDAACFYLTHAYVFALETAHPATQTLFDRLREHRRV